MTGSVVMEAIIPGKCAEPPAPATITAKLFFIAFFAKSNILPLNRIPTSKDTAFLVEYLTSDKSIMINGESITVDGGLNLFGQEELVKNYSK